MTQAAGNNIESTAVVGRPFPKGVSGNPSGRPKGTVGLASYIKAKTNDGQEIADFMMGVMRGEPIEGKSPKIVERIEAARWLADRAWGRPLQQTDINVTRRDRYDLSGKTDAELDAMWEALQDEAPKLVVEGAVRELDVPES